MANRYPDFVMETLRQRLGLDEDDTSRDDLLNMYTPSEVFEEMCNWEGLINYASTIKLWIESIYGIDIDALATETDADDYDEDYGSDADAEEWADDSGLCCADCPPSDCDGKCFSCSYRSF